MGKVMWQVSTRIGSRPSWLILSTESEQIDRQICRSMSIQPLPLRKVMHTSQAVFASNYLETLSFIAELRAF
jgi:hypothetical protein